MRNFWKAYIVVLAILVGIFFVGSFANAADTGAPEKPKTRAILGMQVSSEGIVPIDPYIYDADEEIVMRLTLKDTRNHIREVAIQKNYEDKIFEKCGACSLSTDELFVEAFFVEKKEDGKPIARKGRWKKNSPAVEEENTPIAEKCANSYKAKNPSDYTVVVVKKVIENKGIATWWFYYVDKRVAEEIRRRP